MPFLAFQMPLSNYTRKKNWPTKAEPAGKKCFHDQPEQDLLQCGQQLASQAILIFKAFLPILYKNEVWCQQCEYSCQQKQLWTKKQDNPD